MKMSPRNNQFGVSLEDRDSLFTSHGSETPVVEDYIQTITAPSLPTERGEVENVFDLTPGPVPYPVIQPFCTDPLKDLTSSDSQIFHQLPAINRYLTGADAMSGGSDEHTIRSTPEGELSIKPMSLSPQSFYSEIKNDVIDVIHNFDDERSVDHTTEQLAVAALMELVLTEAQIFPDGNKRTSRAVGGGIAWGPAGLVGMLKERVKTEIPADMEREILEMNVSAILNGDNTRGRFIDESKTNLGLPFVMLAGQEKLDSIRETNDLYTSRMRVRTFVEGIVPDSNPKLRHSAMMTFLQKDYAAAAIGLALPLNKDIRESDPEDIEDVVKMSSLLGLLRIRRIVRDFGHAVLNGLEPNPLSPADILIEQEVNRAYL